MKQTFKRGQHQNEIILPDDFKWERPADNWPILRKQLLDSNCPTDYLDVFEMDSFERRADLAENNGQMVFLAESFGCDNCQDNHNCNEYHDGCEDVPHGGYMLTFEAI